MGLVGTTLKRAGQQGLSAWTLTSPADVAALHEACGVSESVYLATCNRVHLVFVSKPGVAVATVRRRMFSFFAQLERHDLAVGVEPKSLVAYAGEGAIEHLFVVAAALDSVVPGEAQILGQVKAAFQTAYAQGLAGDEMRTIYADAFSIAKEVREHTDLGRGRTSMFSLAMELLEQRLNERTQTSPLRVAVLGVGDMSVQCAKWAQQRGNVAVTVVNRTFARAQALAARYGADAMPLKTFLDRPGAHDAVVSATSSPEPLLFAPTLRQLGPHALLIDLAIARDIDLDSATQLQLPLWDIDRLQTRGRAHAAARRTQLGEARLRIDEALERFRTRQLSRNIGATIEAWRAQSQKVLERTVSETLRTSNRRNTDPERERLADALEQFGRRLLGQWLHGPTLGLKEVGRHFGHEAVDAFAQLAIAPPSSRRSRTP